MQRLQDAVEELEGFDLRGVKSTIVVSVTNARPTEAPEMAARTVACRAHGSMAPPPHHNGACVTVLRHKDIVLHAA